ncbi:MAG: heavy-metal-associated domain-containing protein [Gemmatimonadetes bacterium]|nr:heavy-metal-associated domain-containing protein [Gemmatimonadota bacterium]
MVVLAILWASSAPAQQAKPRPDGRADVVLRVDGLACPFCAYGLDQKLEGFQGIERVEVDLRGGRVLVELKPGATVGDEVFRKVIRESGFALRGIERPRRPAGERG